MKTRLVVLLAVAGLVLTAFMSERRSAVTSAAAFNCSDGWRITGYYTPVETDFTSTETRDIEIRGPGRLTRRTFGWRRLRRRAPRFLEALDFFGPVSPVPTAGADSLKLAALRQGADHIHRDAESLRDFAD